MTHIGIIGSRRRDRPEDLKVVESKFDKIYENGDTIVSGGCSQGADRYAEIFARDKGCTIIIHYPNWKRDDKVADLIRNSRIAEDADVLIACVAEDRIGGTEDTIRKFEALGKTELYLV